MPDPYISGFADMIALYLIGMAICVGVVWLVTKVVKR